MPPVMLTPKIVSTAVLLTFVLVFTSARAEAVSPQGDDVTLPSTGREVTAMRGVDRAVVDFMEKRKIPGGAVAVSYNGRLVHARGFGWADKQNQQPVKPDDLFRIASVSKPLTSVTLLTLFDEGKIDLDDPAVKYLEEDYQPFDGKEINPQLKKVTLRQLLQHAGGFDRGDSFDPMFQPKELFKRLGRPAEASEVIRFMLSRQLDFTPGERYAYSNFGYCMLGRVIEKVTGKSYEAAVQERVLCPAGARRTRIGKTFRQGRFEDEVLYYSTTEDSPCKSIFPNADKTPSEEKTSPYCTFYLKPMDSHGGWISSTIDLLRFVNSVDGRREPALLKPETAKLMIHDTLKKPDGTRSNYALGWGVRKNGDQLVWSHSGSLPGTATMLLTMEDGRSCAVLFNRRDNSGDFFGDLSSSLKSSLREIKAWPKDDQFREYR